MNACTESEKEISIWLNYWKLGKAAVGSSVDYREYKKRTVVQTTEKTLYAYGGLSAVSLGKTCFCHGNPSNCAGSRLKWQNGRNGIAILQ